MTRHTLVLFSLTAALVASAGTADAQWRYRGNRGGAVISVGLGTTGVSFGQYSTGQQYYGSGYNGLQSYSSFGNQFGYLSNGLQSYGSLGNQFGYLSNGHGLNYQQHYYSTPTYHGGQQFGYGGQTYYQPQRTQYYQTSPGNYIVPAAYYRR